ncbi:hypothetical protein [Phaeodactylibacter sp.]|uniref:hypothetical protein n=1 Tax=Phaeodactylibacter sp. TaxID=1940289 RepID=UPI0025ED0DFC|nr:hypothetical protein [Phaeodactylibacter sp.]MCI5093491.1 hypothetical protein [Phaeodactylibacter sp.]
MRKLFTFFTYLLRQLGFKPKKTFVRISQQPSPSAPHVPKLRRKIENTGVKPNISQDEKVDEFIPFEKIAEVIRRSFLHLPPNAERGLRQVYEALKRHEVSDIGYIAYILATAWHETNQTMLPVKEAYFIGEPRASRYREKLPYYPYYGRGFAQITQRANYERFSELLDVDLVDNPDLALEPDIASDILVIGMLKGFSPGAPVLEDFMRGKYPDWHSARKIVNGTDSAKLIAIYAARIYDGLRYG